MSQKATIVSEAELNQALANLPGWEVKEGQLCKQFKFKSFAQALGWMVAAGVEADKLNHHPEWSNVYNRVTVQLTTHDLGHVVSNLDLLLAHKMEQLFN